MTTGSEVAPYDEGTVGLEDVGVGDVILPRVSIVHDEAKFIDNLSKLVLPELDCIILGLVKQRVFWHANTEDDDKPLCKSPDNERGFPNVSEDTKKEKRFPWEKSNFNPADFPPNGPNSVNGLVTLPCAACHFKEWDKNGFDQKVPPCTEQHSFPILYNANPGETGNEIWTAAVFTVQKTGIQPSRRYLSSFAQAKQPMFTVRTRVTLTPQSRGSVKYAVPVFHRGVPTDDSLWSNFGEQARQIREYLRTAPRPIDDDYVPSEGFDNTNSPAPSTPAAEPTVTPPQQAAPAAAPVASPPPTPMQAAPVEDDELPF